MYREPAIYSQAPTGEKRRVSTGRLAREPTEASFTTAQVPTVSWIGRDSETLVSHEGTATTPPRPAQPPREQT